MTRPSGLKAFTRLGPLKGKLCSESEVDFEEDRSNVWLLYGEVPSPVLENASEILSST
jgi:hypothetical protein